MHVAMAGNLHTLVGEDFPHHFRRHGICVGEPGTISQSKHITCADIECGGQPVFSQHGPHQSEIVYSAVIET